MPGNIDDWFKILRQRWGTVPGEVFGEKIEMNRVSRLPEDALVELWRSVRESERSRWRVRGWYHMLYTPLMPGRRVLDFGSGFGIDGIRWAENGAEVVFADIVPANLLVLQKLCAAMKLTLVQFLCVEGLSSMTALSDQSFDVLWAQGSLHNAPFHFMKEEVARLIPKLKVGGRWIQLAYPRERWERDGRPPFTEWGRLTDGEGTPYCEWYDVDKLALLMNPHRFEPLTFFNFHDDDFNWYDLVRRT